MASRGFTWIKIKRFSLNNQFAYRVARYSWPCFSGTLTKVTCPVWATVHVYTGLVTFYKVPK